MTTMSRLRNLESGVNAAKRGGIAISAIKYVDIVVTAALLDGAGSAVVIPANLVDQWKIRDMILVGGGVSFGAGGDRLISLTDGTTIWTSVPNANIEAAPAVSVPWGNAALPFLAGTSDTPSVAGAAISFKYSGGTTDHGGVGSIKFAVKLEKVA